MAEKYQDEGLKGNEKIEEAIAALQREATPEQLAHVRQKGGFHAVRTFQFFFKAGKCGPPALPVRGFYHSYIHLRLGQGRLNRHDKLSAFLHPVPYHGKRMGKLLRCCLSLQRCNGFFYFFAANS